MANHQRKALRRTSSALGCVLVSVFFAVVALWPLSFLSLYCAAHLGWSGLIHRRKGARAVLEREWWIKAKNGVEQDPLDPCCVEFGNTGHVHNEERCTRYRYGRPKPITREERIDIDRAWEEIISHLRDPEYGEET